MSTKKNELFGDLLALGHAAAYAVFPLFIVLSDGLLPPLAFIGITFLIAGAIMMPFALIFERDRLRIYKKHWLPFLTGLVLVICLYFPLLTAVGKHTAAGNIAILTNTQVVFTFVMMGIIGTELINRQRILGAVCILAGVVTILWNGFSGETGKWDLLIVLLTLLPPLANYSMKLVLSETGPLMVSSLRNLLGGSIVLILAYALGQAPLQSLGVTEWVMIGSNAILAFGIGNWMIFAAYKKIGVAKSIALNASSPAFTLLFAWIFLQEAPDWFQLTGLLLVVGGILILSKVSALRFVGFTESGDQIGRQIGFPTINLRTKTRLPHGVYAVVAEWDGEKYQGVMHCGSRPTFGKKERRVEIHLLDFEDHAITAATRVKVEVIGKIRDVEKFSSQEKLIEAIAGDILKARALLAQHSLTV